MEKTTCPCQSTGEAGPTARPQTPPATAAADEDREATLQVTTRCVLALQATPPSIRSIWPALLPAAAASEAFFPFPDGLLVVAEAGATAVIQPGGSMNDQKVIDAADEAGLAMVFTGIRHFRH